METVLVKLGWVEEFLWEPVKSVFSLSGGLGIMLYRRLASNKIYKKETQPHIIYELQNFNV